MIKKRKKSEINIPLPTNERISSLCNLLTRQLCKEDLTRRYAPVKNVLTIIGAAGLVGLAFISPSAHTLAMPFIDGMRDDRWEEWQRYNPYFLKRTIIRLQSQKLIDIFQEGDKQVVRLTKNGKRRILKYALDDLTITEPKSPGHPVAVDYI